MTTEERLERIADRTPGTLGEDDTAWLIAELRRAREALRELVSATETHAPLTLGGFVNSVAKRGLGEP